MKNIPQIKCYALKFHLDYSRSPIYLLIEPLKDYMGIDTEVWSGRELKFNRISPKNPVIFFQYPPPDNILSQKNLKLIWIPMWDHIYNYSLSWWKSFPKNIRIIAFSDTVANYAQRAGLVSFRAKFYLKNGKSADWNQEKVLFYWNRTGLYNKRFLEKLSLSLNTQKIIFQKNIDPGIPQKKYYDLSSFLGKSKIEPIKSYLKRNEYLNRLTNANIYLAPRVREGAGISFLEALARGNAVFAYNSPTMNEYINHKENGYLFKKTSLLSALFKRMKGIDDNSYYSSHLSQNQNWKEIAGLDLKSMGKSAYLMNLEGYKLWKKQIPNFADFILNWH